VVGWCTKNNQNQEYRIENKEKKTKELKKTVEEKPEVVAVAKDLFAGELEEVKDK